MFNSQFSSILKKSRLENGYISWQECGRCAVLARALRIFAPRTGRIFLNTFDGQALKRLGEVLRKYDLQYIVIGKLAGGSGYEVEMEELHKALRSN